MDWLSGYDSPGNIHRILYKWDMANRIHTAQAYLNGSIATGAAPRPITPSSEPG